MDKTEALVLFARSAWVPNVETVLGYKKILNGRHVSVQIGMTERLRMLSKRAADTAAPNGRQRLSFTNPATNLYVYSRSQREPPPDSLPTSGFFSKTDDCYRFCPFMLIRTPRTNMPNSI